MTLIIKGDYLQCIYSFFAVTVVLGKSPMFWFQLEHKTVSVTIFPSYELVKLGSCLACNYPIIRRIAEFLYVHPRCPIKLCWLVHLLDWKFPNFLPRVWAGGIWEVFVRNLSAGLWFMIIILIRLLLLLTNIFFFKE